MELYISSYEYSEFNIARKVVHQKKIKLDARNVLVIEVDRPIIGQKYGLRDKDIIQLFLVNRINENAFDNLSKFPIDVHVLIPKYFQRMDPCSLSDLQNIAWACLYDNEKDAAEHKVV